MALGVVLFGVDSIFSAEVSESVKRLGFTIIAGIITGDAEWDLWGMEHLIKETEIHDELLSLPVIIPWVTPSLRLDRWHRAKKAGFTRFQTIVDPTSVVASSASLADGVFVNSGAVIGSYAILGRSASINRNASVGHHTALGEFVSIGSGATIASQCNVGRGSMIGTGAAVAPGLRIGSNSVVGLGSAVIRDVPDNVMVAGNPAKVLSSRLPE